VTETFISAKTKLCAVVGNITSA